jgi:AcrR family transcriptional regulator
MPTTETTGRERRRSRMRSAILAEALSMMGDVGVDGIALRELARRVDYSPAALYRYFDNRGQIIAALAEESIALLARRLRAAADDRTADPLVAVGEAYLEFASQEPARFRLLFAELPSARNSTGELPPADSPYRIVLDVATNAIAEGRIARELDAEALAFMLWSLVHGMAVLQSTHLRDFDADFGRVQRLALEHLVTSWMPVGRKGARKR